VATKSKQKSKGQKNKSPVSLGPTAAGKKTKQNQTIPTGGTINFKDAQDMWREPTSSL